MGNLVIWIVSKAKDIDYILKLQLSWILDFRLAFKGFHKLGWLTFTVLSLIILLWVSHHCLHWTAWCFSNTSAFPHTHTSVAVVPLLWTCRSHFYPPPSSCWNPSMAEVLSFKQQGFTLSYPSRKTWFKEFLHASWSSGVGSTLETKCSTELKWLGQRHQATAKPSYLTTTQVSYQCKSLSPPCPPRHSLWADWPTRSCYSLYIASWIGVIRVTSSLLCHVSSMSPAPLPPNPRVHRTEPIISRKHLVNICWMNVWMNV